MFGRVGSIEYFLSLQAEQFKQGLAEVSTKMSQFKDATAQKLGAIDQVGDRFTEVGKKMQNVGAKMSLGITAPLALIGKQAFAAASDLDESMSKINVVFGDSSKAIVEWSKTSAEAMGMSQQQALEAAGTYGNLFQAFGLAQKPSEDMSKNLVQLAADLASFNNASPEETLLALRSGLSGETEPLKRFGIALSDARLKEEAMSLGLIKSTKEALNPAAKSQAAYSLIMKDSTLAQGDFARTADGAANKQRIMKAQFDNAKASLGTALIPIFLQFAKIIQKVAGWFESLTDKQKKWIVYIGIALAALGPIVTILGTLGTAIGAVLSPVGLVIAAIALLVAGLVYAYFKFEGFRKVVDKVWDAIVATVKWAWEKVIKPIWNFLVWYVTTIMIPMWEKIWPVVQSVWNKIVEIVKWAWSNIIQPLWDAIVWYVTTILVPMWSKIWDVVKVVWDKISAVIKFVWDNIIKPIWDILYWYVTTILVPMWQKIWDVVKAVWDKVSAVIKFVWENVIKPIWDILKWYITEVLIPTFQAIYDKVKPIFDKVVEFIKDAWDRVKAGFDKVKEWVTNLIAVFTGIKQKIKDAFNGAKEWLKDIGKDIINGLMDGAKSILKKIGEIFLKVLPSWIKEPFKKALGIKSPSTVFKSYGVNIVEGLVDGLIKTQGLSGAMDNMNRMLTVSGSQFTPAVSGVASAPSGGGLYQVTVNMDGVWTSSRADRRDVAKDFIDAVNDELISKGLNPIGDGKISGSAG